MGAGRQGVHCFTKGINHVRVVKTHLITMGGAGGQGGRRGISTQMIMYYMNKYTTKH